MNNQPKTFIQWMIEKRFREDEDVVDEKWVSDVIDGFSKELKEHGLHQGDCTKESQPCLMCTMEIYLHDYYHYMRKLQVKNE